MTQAQVKFISDENRMLREWVKSLIAEKEKLVHKLMDYNGFYNDSYRVNQSMSKHDYTNDDVPF